MKHSTGRAAIRPTLLICAATLAVAAHLGTAFAAEAPPQNLLSLQASATIEVDRDLLTLSFTTTREGTDAASVQSGLKTALDAALKEAKSAARPDGQLEVRTGNFSLYPRYAPKGGISGWQGSAELVVEGRDMVGISQLSGRITTMTIGRVATSLSRTQREKVEGEVAAQAIARYRDKAAEYAKVFGFSSFQIREVNVQTGEAGGGYVPMMARAKSLNAAADEALPVEAGKGNVTATVNGSVTMSR